MEWMTKVDITRAEKQIGYQDKILLLGSCFADNMGAKFAEHYFQATANPYGTLYNPASIAVAIANSQQPLSDHRILQHNGMWHSMMHHGSFSHPKKAEVLKRTKESQEVLRLALQETTTIIVTFGTAWVYELEGEIVANCHKFPPKAFVRRRLTVEDILALWRPILQQMPDKHWIFTVSPIRHIKDGLHENQVSKAILLQAIEQIKQSGEGGMLSYFPSYEIMIDELRDYRFYAEDMVHPSSQAVEYIWQRFVDTYTNKDTQNQMRVLNQLWRDQHHTLLHPESDEAQAFLQRLEQRKLHLQTTYPWIE